MGITMKKFLFICLCWLLTGCASYTGDKLISLTHLPVQPESHAALVKTEEMVSKLYDHFKLPEERKISMDGILSYGLVQDNKPVEFSHEQRQVFLINGDIRISHCYNSVVVATGSINISHGGRNILVSGKNIRISHDRGNSIVIAGGHVDIAFATNTTVYAPGGVKISHPDNVIAYNTENRETSWGHVNNVLIDPLFRAEKNR